MQKSNRIWAEGFGMGPNPTLTLTYVLFMGPVLTAEAPGCGEEQL